MIRMDHHGDFMPTLVEQIQRDASNNSIPVFTLLRRAKIAAAKLNLSNVESWIEHELDGYIGVDVPDYRKITGRMMAWNPYNGWIPILGELPEQLAEMDVRQSLESLEDLLRKDKNNGIHMPVPAELCSILDDMLYQSNSIRLGRYAVHFGRGHVIGITNSVRNTVLTWSLNLEKAGITGTEFSFSSEEKSRAKEAATMVSIGSIGSMNGNIGSNNTTGNIITGNIDVSQTRELISQMRQHQSALASEGIPSTDLSSRLELLETELKRQKPNHSVLSGALADVRNMVSGAGGGLISTGVLAALSKILGP